MLHKTIAVKFTVVFLFSSRLLHEGFSKRPKPDPTRTEQDSSKTKPLDKKIKPTNRNFSIKSLHSAFFPFLCLLYLETIAQTGRRTTKSRRSVFQYEGIGYTLRTCHRLAVLFCGRITNL